MTLQVGPLLPYGDWKVDASKFAQLLVENADYIYVRPITDGSEKKAERKSEGNSSCA